MNNKLEIAIGEKIKSFRRKREITQEQLADYLNISFQSVSKWECGDAYPDITMLPKIALFFGITTDELLCIDKLKEQEEVEKYLVSKMKSYAVGDTEEAVALMREATAKYPGNFKIMLELAESLKLAACASADNNLFEEILSIGEKIRAECRDDNIRRDILSVMCYSYYWRNDNEKAVQLINENLGSYTLSREIMLEEVLKGDDLIRQRQMNLMNFIFHGLRNMQYISENFALDEKIEVYENIIKIYAMIYTHGEYMPLEVSYLRIELTKMYIVSRNNSKALEHLKRASELTIMFDTLANPTQFISPLINKLAHISLLKNYKENESYRMLYGIHGSSGLNDEKFNPIRDTPEFKEIYDELIKHAKNNG